ncbi:putative lipoprotein, partial [Vibrio parahaemolyticus VP2007-007]
KSCVFLLTRTW